MTISGNQLLAALGSGILPAETPRVDGESGNTLNFDDVLARIQRGESSDLGIDLAKGLSVSQVSDDMKAQAARAADLGAVNGLSKAIVDTGTSFLRLDVTNRVVEAQIEHQSEQVLDRIDGFISMKPTAQQPTDAASSEPPLVGQILNPISSPARSVRNSSLADVLAARGR